LGGVTTSALNDSSSPNAEDLENVIRVRGLTKRFVGPRTPAEGVLALDNIDLDVRQREFLTVIGPSGCGKTTLLRVIAGLVPFDSGSVTVNGKPVTGPGPDRAVVFQAFALLPWATVIDNIAFGLRLRGVPERQRRSIARDWIRVVGLEGFEDRLPKELSGGMQQRVGLARALAVDPEILLMDEPFGSLDEQTRRLLQEELLRIWEEHRKTVIFVTHSMEEAVLLGDRILLLSPRPGRVKELIDVPLGRPRDREAEHDLGMIETRQHLWDQLRGMQVL
jgi:NitT/TauT family transport system ATP-binding protein